MIKLLLEHGADICTKDKQSLSALYCAAECGSTEVVHSLLEYGAIIDMRNASTYSTALMIAAQRGNVSVCQMLLSYGNQSMVDLRNKFGRTALSSAAEEGELEVVNTLVDAGASINTRQAQSWTPLHYAADKNHLEVVRVLLEHGADKSAKSRDGKTPLLFAALKGHSECVELLKERGPSPA